MGKPDGGPAFPAMCTPSKEYFTPSPQFGMTLRQWYAGQALAGLLASYANPGAMEAPKSEYAASVAFTYADAMLAHEAGEREQEG